MGIADKYISNSKSQISNLENMKWWHALVIGLAQVIAFIPGTSRSGITITAALFSKIDRATAARYSFLMGIPLIAAAGLSSLIKLLHEPEVVNYGQLIIGLVASFVVGYFAVAWLIKYLSTHNLRWFVIYRVVLGILLIILLL